METTDIEDVDVPCFQNVLWTRLYELYEHKQFCDAVVHVPTGSLKVHKVVLLAASSYICGLESQQQTDNASLSLISSYRLPVGDLCDLESIVRLLYTGKLSLSSVNIDKILELCVFLNIDDAVVEFCQTFSYHCSDNPMHLTSRERKKCKSAVKKKFPSNCYTVHVSNDFGTVASEQQSNHLTINSQSETLTQNEAENGNEESEMCIKMEVESDSEYIHPGYHANPEGRDADHQHNSIISCHRNDLDVSDDQLFPTKSENSNSGPPYPTMVYSNLATQEDDQTNCVSEGVSQHDFIPKNLKKCKSSRKKSCKRKITKIPKECDLDRCIDLLAPKQPRYTEIRMAGCNRNERLLINPGRSGTKAKQQMFQKVLITESDTLDSNIDYTEEYDAMINNIKQPNTQAKTWSCALCPLLFISRRVAEEHRADVHPLERFSCFVCNASFSTRAELHTHKEADHPDIIKCHKCVAQPHFSSVKELDRHRRQEHEKGSTIRCIVCKVVFKSRAEKRTHMNSVHPSGLGCTECNFVFKYWKCLVDHLHRIHNIPYDMDQYDVLCCTQQDCTYQTVCSSRLKNHAQDVHGTKQLECTTCGLLFRSRKALLGHRKRHLDRDQRQDFQCDQCGKKFLSANALKNHIVVLHEKKARNGHLCHLCPKICVETKSMHNHLLRAHGVLPPDNVKLYRCSQCDFFTVHKTHLTVHERRHNAGEKTRECTICRKKFMFEQHLSRHMTHHQLKDNCCPIEGCSYTTKYKRSLREHIARLHTHKDYKPFLCPHCDYRCKEKGNLNKHITGKHKIAVTTTHNLRENAIKSGKGYPNYSKMDTSQISSDMVDTGETSAT